MDLTPSPQEEAFRTQARAWLAANMPEPFEGEHTIEDPGYVPYLRAWQRKLAEGGFRQRGEKRFVMLLFPVKLEHQTVIFVPDFMLVTGIVKKLDQL